MSGYIFIVWPTDYQKNNECVYKIGSTKDIKLNMETFPKKSVLILNIHVKNMTCIHKHVSKQFKEDFKERLDVGKDFFEGNVGDMMKAITSYTQTK